MKPNLLRFGFQDLNGAAHLFIFLVCTFSARRRVVVIIGKRNVSSLAGHHMFVVMPVSCITLPLDCSNLAHYRSRSDPAGSHRSPFVPSLSPEVLSPRTSPVLPGLPMLTSSACAPGWYRRFLPEPPAANQ